MIYQVLKLTHLNDEITTNEVQIFSNELEAQKWFSEQRALYYALAFDYGHDETCFADNITTLSREYKDENGAECRWYLELQRQEFDFEVGDDIYCFCNREIRHEVICDIKWDACRTDENGDLVPRIVTTDATYTGTAGLFHHPLDAIDYILRYVKANRL